MGNQACVPINAAKVDVFSCGVLSGVADLAIEKAQTGR
jgi:hypothetical protein